MKVTFSVTFNPTKEDVEKYESADAYIKRMISDSLADFTNPEKWSIEEDTQPEPDSQPEPDTQPNLAPGPPNFHVCRNVAKGTRLFCFCI